MRLVTAVLLSGLVAAPVLSVHPAAACDDDDAQVVHDRDRVHERARQDARREAMRAAREAMRQARREAKRARKRARAEAKRAMKDARRAMRDAQRVPMMPMPDPSAGTQVVPDLQRKLDKLQRKLDKLRQQLDRLAIPAGPIAPQGIDFEWTPDGGLQIDGDLRIDFD